MKNTMQKLISAVLAVMLMLSLCAGVFSVSAAEELTSVNKWNLILGDEIGAKFYVSVDDSVSEEAVMVVTDGYGTQEYPISAAQTDNSGNYIFSARLAAAQLADNITLQLHDGDIVGAVHSYTTVDYAKAVMNGNYGDSTKSLVKAMLNYGAMAQKYFNYNTENLANAGYESTESVEIPAVDASGMVSGKVSGISFYGASLVFQSKVAVRFYFKVTGNIADYTFSTGTPIEKDGMYYIEVADINPQDYANTITLTVNDALTVSYSPLTYISRMVNSSNADMVNLVKAMYAYYQAAINYVPDAVVRGQEIAPSTDLTIELGNTEVLETLSFDYKVTSGTFNIALNPDWDSQFGYFAFDANGNVDPYDGVTLENLEDGYIRVTFELDALTKYSGNPSKALSFLYIRGGWTDAIGYIDNVQYKVYKPVTVFDGGEFFAGQDLTVELANAQAVSVLSFDYKITSGETIVFAIMPDWDSYYGYYAFDANGSVDGDSGFTTENLADGYIRVFIDVAELNKISGTPSDVLTMIYIRGSWTTANGVIENIRINESAYLPSRGQQIAAGSDLVLELGNTQNLESLSFDYKVTSGVFNIALNPDWDNHFGYFAFDANGNVDAYDGVSLETLEDGYIRVTFDMAALTKYSGNPGNALSFLYIRGIWTDATGYIDNIQYVVEEVVAPENRGQEIIPGTDLSIPLNNIEVLESISFEYKVSGTFNLALMLPGWESYYGYFTFDGNGNVDPYDGVSLELLEDGYYRVTFDIATLTKYVGTPDGAIELIYIRGNWTDATGYIDNVQCEVYVPTTVFEGGQFLAGQGLTVELANDQAISKLSFDYKITSGDAMVLALMPDWDNYFGYYAFDANGNIDADRGITTKVLDNGYIRVYVDMSALNKISGNPSKMLTMIYIRGDWTTADGVIENIRINDSVERVSLGEKINSGTDLTLEIPNTSALTTLSFDYKLSSGTFNISLNPNWDSYFGYFAFDANGNVDPYDGVTLETLSDGYIRVTFDMTKLTKWNGSPSSVISFLYIRGAWTDASGYIDNIQFA